MTPSKPGAHAHDGAHSHEPGGHCDAVGHGAEMGGEGGQRFAGAAIPPGRYQEDDGSTPPDVAAAFAAWRRSGDLTGVVDALRGARLLVALVANLDSADPAGAEKDSHMAAATLVRPSDGRTALLAFTSVAALAAWHADARPLPVAAVDVARAAIGDGAAAILIDGQCALAGPYLWALAEDRHMLAPGDDEEVRQAIAEEISRALGGAGLPTSFELAPGDRPGAVVVLLRPEVVADREAVAALAQALSEHALLRRRLTGALSIGVAR